MNGSIALGYFSRTCFEILGNRKWDDLLGENENLKLKLKAIFEICFGVGYEEKEEFKSITNKVTEKSLKLFNEQHYSKHFSCTFISIKNKDNGRHGTYFLIWLENSKDSSTICLDFDGRVYTSWENFINNNKLPKCYMIYPKYGRYCSSLGEDFMDLVFKESIAKSSLEVAVSGLGLAASFILVLNPISAPILFASSAALAVSAGYGVANSISQLSDIRNHEGGLSYKDPNTLLAFGQLGVSVFGSLAVGAAAGAKGILAKAGTVVSESSFMYRLANSVGQITKIVSGINAGFYLLVVINNYNTNGEIRASDIKYLASILFFSFNVLASEALISNAVKFLAASFTFDRIVDFCLKSTNAVYSTVKKVIKFFSDNHLDELIKQIFPNFQIYFERFSNLGSLIQKTSLIVDLTVSTMTQNKFDINYIYHMTKQLSELWNEVTMYKENCEKQILKKFDNEILQTVNTWVQNDGIDLITKNNEIDSNKYLKSNCVSRYDNTINSPLEIKKRVSETIRNCCGHVADYEIYIREKILYSELLKLIKLHVLPDNEFLMDKFSLYCNFFQALYSKLMDLYHFEHFLFKINENVDVSKNKFFSMHYQINNIHESVFDISCKILEENINKFHKIFVDDFKGKSSFNDRKGNIIFEISMPCFSNDIIEEKFYEKAKELIPKFEGKMNSLHCSCDIFDGLAIIKSDDDDFICFFYTYVENNYLKGILLFVEEISV